MLRTYENKICLLDATYKSTRYTLPPFFMVVKANVDYGVVGVFVCEREGTTNIFSALKTLKSWNPNSIPLYSMVDCCSEEINAIEFLACVLSDMFNKKVTVIIGVNSS